LARTLALRLAYEQLAERTRAVLWRSELVKAGLAPVDEETLASIQGELRAIKADQPSWGACRAKGRGATARSRSR